MLVVGKAILYEWPVSFCTGGGSYSYDLSLDVTESRVCTVVHCAVLEAIS